MTLRIRWLGTLDYEEALALQHGLHRGAQDHLLLLEHPHVYTLGVRADLGHLLVEPATVGATLSRADRGGDITYHGPGQLVGYPILDVPGKRGGGMADTVAYVTGVEQVVIDVLTQLGVAGAGRRPGFPGVWVEPEAADTRKIAAIGVRLTRGRSMHGFALNVDPDLAMFDHIVPCGIPDKAVTSVAAELRRGDPHAPVPTMRDVVDLVATVAADRWGNGGVDRADIIWRPSRDDDDLVPFSRGLGAGDAVGRTGHTARVAEPTAPPGPRPVQLSGRLRARMDEAGVGAGVAVSAPKPDHVKARVRITDDYVRLKKTMRDLDLVTVCEEAGCPNIFECWSQGTATFMVAGERCTRKCGFCLVDTSRPLALDAGEPARVAEAVERMGLRFAVLTMVARDDLADGAAGHVAATVAAIRDRTPDVGVETLISDCKGDGASLQVIFDARPDVLNHNIESVARLQRVVRPSAGYGRSLGVLARASAEHLTTKSSIIVGMGETDDEVVSTMADLAGVGVDIVTIGQYLRPTTNHLPVDRWVDPEQFDLWKKIGESELGISHVEASPLTRSSYHAADAADAAQAAAHPA